MVRDVYCQFCVEIIATFQKVTTIMGHSLSYQEE